MYTYIPGRCVQWLLYLQNSDDHYVFATVQQGGYKNVTSEPRLLSRTYRKLVERT